ncbi:GNAT superfamily N-acetyltransferase [Azospirillum lipoferum]|uniref:GNAT family N-acetyltransferase n=1 Tax=Azospirillum TaxID=191 RepID=UPI001B3BF1F2|nr:MULTISPECIES: GNAT family N-acetyltransferase [Azospirillum]MCP1614222.1 GNAT superfamily N-acetyltransferase [Azospirillum lipoferum]MDW5536907.1 GNAT family N-acetyltransferase [Azospirillum sp. NL1]
MAGFSGSFPFPGNLTARFTTPADETFLLDLFIEARPWLAWAQGSPDFLRALYEQQYRAMRAGQEAIYPEHVDLVVEKAGDRVGRVVVDLGYRNWRVSELQVLERARGKGVGSDVLRGLQMAATGPMMGITLSTPIIGSNGRQVYQRLGFRTTGYEPPHFHMGWLPPGHPEAEALETLSAQVEAQAQAHMTKMMAMQAQARAMGALQGGN